MYFGSYCIYVLLNIRIVLHIIYSNLWQWHHHFFQGKGILINENIFPLKVSSLRRDGLYLGITNSCKNTHFTYRIFQYTCFNCTSLAHMLNVYMKMCLNTTNYPIFNMQDFRYRLCTSILDYLVSWYPHYVLGLAQSYET